jgi:hypothetical protein
MYFDADGVGAQAAQLVAQFLVDPTTQLAPRGRADCKTFAVYEVRLRREPKSRAIEPDDIPARSEIENRLRIVERFPGAAALTGPKIE